MDWLLGLLKFRNSRDILLYLKDFGALKQKKIWKVVHVKLTSLFVLKAHVLK